MTERRILLHMGTHKTGTTSLQRTLDAHRDVLRAAGVGYLGGPGPYPHLYSAFLADKRLFAWNRIGKLSDAEIRERDAAAMEGLARELGEGTEEVAILSSEYLSMLAEDEMTALRDFLARFGEVHAVYYYRELLAWISSDSQQLAKAGLRSSPTTFRTAMQRLFDFPLRIRQVFGERTCFVKFEDAVEGAGITDTLLTQFDLPTLAHLGRDEVVANEGLSDNAVRALFLYNRLHPAGSPGRDPATVRQLKALPGGKYRVAGFRRPQLARYERKRARVEKELGLKLAPPEELPASPSLDPLVDEMLALVDELKHARDPAP